MLRALVFILSACLAACSSIPETADPYSDAPEAGRRPILSFTHAGSYQEALQAWQTPEDVNAWIGARFRYDLPRAVALSETQRNGSKRMTIYEPQDFFDAPSGVCVDLARFAVETLRQIDPDSKPKYLMIEFDPIQIAGNTLRRHWLASFRRDGKHFFFADSKRPGHIAGPYADTQEFIDAYAKYRGRHIVAFRELDSFQRRQRSLKRISDVTKAKQFLHPAEHIGKALNLRTPVPFDRVQHPVLQLMDPTDMPLPSA